MDLVTQQLHERRERILSTARELIGEVGYQALTMRELAARCRVSVPTLYNQFGSKNELLATAVRSHFSGLLGSQPSDPGLHGHAHLVAVVRLCAGEMTRLPGYHRKLVGAFMEVRDTTTTQANLTSDLAEELSQALLEMRARKQLADWVDPQVLSQQMTWACVMGSVAWAIGMLDDEGLEASMLHAACSLVLGGARGAAKTALEAEVVRAQASLARRPGSVPTEDALPSAAEA